MKAPRDLLLQLLNVTKREQAINGKTQPQVTGCVLVLADNRVSTTSIVKDGKTSLSRFSFVWEQDGDELIPVPDIDRLLGVLKYHADVVVLTHSRETGKVLVKSKNKQTTLVGGLDSKAFANSQQSLLEWHKASVERAKQINSEKRAYKLQNGAVRNPFCSFQIPATEVYDALRCDGINGQKLNRYTFTVKNELLTVSVGDHFKGLTDSELCKATNVKDFTATFEGGLENILKHYTGIMTLSFLDFREEGQGIRLLLSFANGDWVFQAGVI